MEEKEIDAHNVTVEELCKRFNTSIEAGLTDKQVAEALEEHDAPVFRTVVFAI